MAFEVSTQFDSVFFFLAVPQQHPDRGVIEGGTELFDSEGSQRSLRLGSGQPGREESSGPLASRDTVAGCLTDARLGPG